MSYIVKLKEALVSSQKSLRYQNVAISDFRKCLELAEPGSLLAKEVQKNITKAQKNKAKAEVMIKELEKRLEDVGLNQNILFPDL